MGTPVDPVVRLMRRRRITESGCWEWTRSVKSNGYAQIGYQGRMWTAHRLAWVKLVNEDLPKNMMVLHRCDNRRCFNPDHLFLGTASDNMRDMISKGRQRFLGGPKGERQHHAKLTNTDVLNIRARRRSIKEIRAEYGISKSQASKILLGTAWKHLLPLSETGEQPGPAVQ